MRIDHLTCRDGELRKSLWKRRAARNLAVRRFLSHRSWEHSSNLERSVRSIWSKTSKTSVPWLTREMAFPLHHGSQVLAAVMGRWPLFSRSGSRKLPRIHRCLKIWPQLTQARARQCGHQSEEALRQHSLFSNISHAFVRISDNERKGSRPTARATSLMLVDRNPRWVGLHWVNKLLPALKAGNPEEKIWIFVYTAAAKMFDSATVSPGFNGMTMYQTRHSGASIDRVRDFSTLLKAQNEVDGTTLCRPLRNK